MSSYFGCVKPANFLPEQNKINNELIKSCYTRVLVYKKKGDKVKNFIAVTSGRNGNGKFVLELYQIQPLSFEKSTNKINCNNK